MRLPLCGAPPFFRAPAPLLAAACASCLALASCAGRAPVRLESETLGPTLLVVAGIHGDEPSGPRAARALIARGPSLRGRLLVVPEAFPEAVAAQDRSLPGAVDMNRAFPGGRSDRASERALSLFRQIRRLRPDLVLDLHESDGTWTEGRGPVLVVPANTRAASLCLAMLETPGMEEFSFTGGPPKGSLSAEAARVLDIPVLVVEIPDDLPLERRVGLHLLAVDAALGALGMMDTGLEGRIKPCR